MSAKDDCAPIAELIKRFCTENNLPEVSDQWPLNLIHPSGGVAVPNAARAPAGEYPPLVCDYCGALTSDPWHSSGMLHGKMSKHIHSCDSCVVEAEVQKQDEALIWLMLTALEHHTEQTRPIARTDDAITAALLRLKGKT